MITSLQFIINGISIFGIACVQLLPDSISLVMIKFTICSFQKVFHSIKHTIHTKHKYIHTHVHTYIHTYIHTHIPAYIHLHT